MELKVGHPGGPGHLCVCLTHCRLAHKKTPELSFIMCSGLLEAKYEGHEGTGKTVKVWRFQWKDGGLIKIHDPCLNINRGNQIMGCIGKCMKVIVKTSQASNQS